MKPQIQEANSTHLPSLLDLRVQCGKNSYSISSHMILSAWRSFGEKGWNMWHLSRSGVAEEKKALRLELSWRGMKGVLNLQTQVAFRVEGYSQGSVALLKDKMIAEKLAYK